MCVCVKIHIGFFFFFMNRCNASFSVKLVLLGDFFPLVSCGSLHICSELKIWKTENCNG